MMNPEVKRTLLLTTVILPPPLRDVATLVGCSIGQAHPGGGVREDQAPLPEAGHPVDQRKCSAFLKQTP